MAEMTSGWRYIDTHQLSLLSGKPVLTSLPSTHFTSRTSSDDKAGHSYKTTDLLPYQASRTQTVCHQMHTESRQLHGLLLTIQHSLKTTWWDNKWPPSKHSLILIA